MSLYTYSVQPQYGARGEAKSPPPRTRLASHLVTGSRALRMYRTWSDGLATLIRRFNC